MAVHDERIRISRIYPTLVIIALYRGYIVLGRHYVELAKKRDFWRTVALKGLNAAEMATTLAERQTAGE